MEKDLRSQLARDPIRHMRGGTHLFGWRHDTPRNRQQIAPIGWQAVRADSLCRERKRRASFSPITRRSHATDIVA